MRDIHIYKSYKREINLRTRAVTSKRRYNRKRLPSIQTLKGENHD